jgi:hypothetical protein
MRAACALLLALALALSAAPSARAATYTLHAASTALYAHKSLSAADTALLAQHCANRTVYLDAALDGWLGARAPEHTLLCANVSVYVLASGAAARRDAALKRWGADLAAALATLSDERATVQHETSPVKVDLGTAADGESVVVSAPSLVLYRSAQICRSTDGGASWSASFGGLGTVKDLLAMPFKMQMQYLLLLQREKCTCSGEGCGIYMLLYFEFLTVICLCMFLAMLVVCISPIILMMCMRCRDAV